MSNLLELIKDCREGIDNCLSQPNSDPIIENFRNKYDWAYGRMQKSLASEFYMGQVLAYKEILNTLGVKV